MASAGGGGGGGGRPRKRHRRGGGGDSVEDFHRDRAAREAERNADAKKRAQEVSHLLKDEKALKEEIERLKAEGGGEKDHTSTIHTLEGALVRHKQDAERRAAQRERESEIAIKRRMAAGLGAGPAPPAGDPSRWGPGFPPPRPPPFREAPPPPPPPHPPVSQKPPPPRFDYPPPQLPYIQPKAAKSDRTQMVPEDTQPSSTVAKPPPPRLFMPTAVAVQLKKQQQHSYEEDEEER